MSCSMIFHLPKAPPSSLCKPQLHLPPLSLRSEQKPSHYSKPNKAQTDFHRPIISSLSSKIPSLAIQVGAILSTVAAVPPVYAVTGVNDEDDLITVLIQLGISAFIYFLVAPPIIMNWLRIRWYRRKLLEMYLQFMFVFLFFPGLMLWAPFLNFRKFPRDPEMKYPWSKPQNPEKIRNTYRKYPWATPEDYDSLT